jgi:predicted transcriptional regulator
MANYLREVRQSRMISITELARKSGVAQLTIARIEKGAECRKETKRKILMALGLSPWEKEKVFPKT